MQISRFYKNRVLLVFLSIIALAGSVFFLPLHLNGKYTCFYHQVVDHNHPVLDRIGDVASIGGGAVHENSIQGGSSMEADAHGQDLLHTYLSHYAFFWWGSLALVVFCLYRLRLLTINKKNEANYMEEQS